MIGLCIHKKTDKDKDFHSFVHVFLQTQTKKRCKANSRDLLITGVVRL